MSKFQVQPLATLQTRSSSCPPGVGSRCSATGAIPSSFRLSGWSVDNDVGWGTGVPRSYAEGCNTHALVLLES